MKLHTVRETYTPGDVFTLYPLGDIHLGSANCDRGLLRETIQEIAEDPNARWCGGGDYCEFIAPDDKRWHAGGIDENIVTLRALDKLGDVYVDLLIDLFRPIINKCWWFLYGNHEESFEHRHHTDICDRILKALGRPELQSGWSAITRVEFDDGNNHRNAWRIFQAHGWQAGRLDGAKLNQCKLAISYIDADVLMWGHSHSRFMVPATRLETDAAFTKLIAHDIYVGHTGSFLRTYQQDATGYAERKGYPPTSLGPIKLRFRPGRDGRKRLEAVQ